MGFDEYKRVKRHGLWFVKAINRHVTILVRSEHENPLGNAISARPPRGLCHYENRVGEAEVKYLISLLYSYG